MIDFKGSDALTAEDNYLDGAYRCVGDTEWILGIRVLAHLFGCNVADFRRLLQSSGLHLPSRLCHLEAVLALWRKTLYPGKLCACFRLCTIVMLSKAVKLMVSRS